MAAYAGEGRAHLWYWGQVLNVLPRKLGHSAFWGVIMFANYLKVAFRNLVKRKGYAVINISGLAIGMACCILILLWVRDELSYDRFHQEADVNAGRTCGTGGRCSTCCQGNCAIQLFGESSCLQTI